MTSRSPKRIRAWLMWLKDEASVVIQRTLRGNEAVPTSSDYELIDAEKAAREAFDGWRDRIVAERQDATFRALIERMYSGEVRIDFVVATEAVRKTGIKRPSILEVGCGSGYYAEVLPHLLEDSIDYTGVDYSPAMIQMAREQHRQRTFAVADATDLPFCENTFDIVLNGVSLMHIPRYESAIRESRRVARNWCIFHSVPVLKHRETTILSKKAYGHRTIEIIFNEGELRRLLEQSRITVRYAMPSIPYNLETILGEPTVTKTYVCEVME